MISSSVLASPSRVLSSSLSSSSVVLASPSRGADHEDQTGLRGPGPLAVRACSFPCSIMHPGNQRWEAPWPRMNLTIWFLSRPRPPLGPAHAATPDTEVKNTVSRCDRSTDNQVWPPRTWLTMRISQHKLRQHDDLLSSVPIA